MLFGGSCFVFCWVVNSNILFCCCCFCCFSWVQLLFNLFVLWGFLYSLVVCCFLLLSACCFCSCCRFSIVGMCCWLRLEQSSFSSVGHVLGFGGVLDLVLVSWLHWYWHFPWYLGFFWALAIWVASLYFLGVFGLCQSMLLKDSNKFVDPYFPMFAFLSENRVPVFRLLSRDSARGFGLRFVFSPKPTIRIVISANVALQVWLFFGPPDMVQKWAAVTFQ